MDQIKNLIKAIDNKPSKYGKGFMKIKFNSDDSLPLNKILKLRMLTLFVRSIFEEGGKILSTNLFLEKCLLEL